MTPWLILSSVTGFLLGVATVLLCDAYRTAVKEVEADREERKWRALREQDALMAVLVERVKFLKDTVGVTGHE